MNSSKKLAKNDGVGKDTNDVVEIGGLGELNKYKVLGIIGILVILVLGVGICYMQLRPRAILEVTRTDGTNKASETVYLKDAMYNIASVENQYNAYSSIYQQLYGSTYWEMEDADGKGRDGSSAAKKQIMDTIKQETVLSMEAKALGYSLTDAEKKPLQDQAKKFVDGLTDSQKKLDGLDTKTIEKVLERSALADKYRNIILSESGFKEDEVKATVDKKEFRQYDLQYYMISNTKDDKDVDKATKAKNFKAMQELKKKAEKTKDFSKLVLATTGAGAVSASAISGDSVSAEESGINAMKTEKIIAKDINESSFLDKKTRKQLIKMKKGEISDVIEGSDGYYLVRMDNDNSTEAYDQECESVVNEEKDNKVKAKLKEILPKYQIEVQAYWKKRVNIGYMTSDGAVQ
ncbi:peptidylprolyl isomerase [Eubacterium xylanophilum]|uniref:peptidylprolyl isomerase n=1 Tax=Eubacterium xylanophilum TaxID=39497 RepID=UPI00047B0F9D|nr:peptidyl-prolyl cis-trans isomerase [Eubacterium xylanophilum]